MNIIRRGFDPAIRFLNHFTFPRKFFIAGTLVVLPLFFITWQYIETLSDRVEMAQQELVGNRAIRQLIPMWRTLRELRYESLVSRYESDAAEKPIDVSASTRVADSLHQLQSQLAQVLNADKYQIEMFGQCSRWMQFQSRLKTFLRDQREESHEPNPEVLQELIDDFHTIIRQVADLSNLSVDQHLESQNLATSITTVIPRLIDMEDQLRDRIAIAGRGDSLERLDLDLAEFNGGLNLLFAGLHQRLRLPTQRNPDEGNRLKGLLSACQLSIKQIETGIRRRHFQSDNAPSLAEIDAITEVSTEEAIGLLNACQDVFDEVVALRAHHARHWRFGLILAALLPLGVAAYLVVGLCLAIIRTADQMRDVTNSILSENSYDPTKMTVGAQDELGRMIEHFGQLSVRLREELVLVQEEAVRASAAEESLRVNQERFNLVLQGANDGIWDWDLQTDRVFYSDRFKELLGYDKGEFDVWLSALADVLHPDDFDMTWRAVERHFQDREPYHIEHRLKTSSGEYRWFLERGQAVWDENGVPIRMAGSISDITGRKATESRDRIRNHVLELLAAGASLNEVLVPLVKSVESENSRLRCSVLFLDKEGKRLMAGPAPSLPDFYNHAIDGIEIGMGVGSCGTAAFLGQRVVVEDIATHPYWAVARDIAIQAGLASCWSEPIRGMSGTVLGTFAIYGTEVGSPSESEIRLIEVAANLAGIAIERKRVDAALLESEERWNFALEGAGDGVWDWNIKTGEMVFSRRWCEMLGFEEDELASTHESWKSRIHPDEFSSVMASLTDYLEHRTATYMHEHRMVCRDGNSKWILSRGMIVSTDPSGAPLRMIGTHSDITDRKRMEEDSKRYLQQVEASRDRITEQSIQLIRQSEELARARDQAEAAARAKSEFLANMSHELRTPLTAILGYADLLVDSEHDIQSQRHREAVEIIRTNGRHLQELIDDILDFSKIEADRMVMDFGPASPRQLVEDVLRLMKLRAREKGLELKPDYRYPIPDRIITDALRVRQILVNLIGNAIKFTERGAIIVTIRYDANTNRQIISVTDSGIGIKPEQLALLFTPFSQADASMSRRFGGTGLGLSISKRLAQMLGGDIIAESEFGAGSTFSLEIAADPGAGSIMLTEDPKLEERIVPKPNSEPVLKLEGRILLAEDVIANQKLIAFLLQKWGAKVEVVDNGALAVKAALLAASSESPFDLILMDIQMPEMDGYTATAMLRSSGYAGRIIALTAHASNDDRDRCLQSGFDGFAVKPIQKDQLYAVCREHLEQTPSHSRVGD